MRSQQSVKRPDGATVITAEFELTGGMYQVQAVATAWAGGNLVLQQQSVDPAKWLDHGLPFTDDSGQTLYLPPGNFRWSVTGAPVAPLTATTRLPLE